MFDPLSDSSLATERVEPRSGEEICRIKHRDHMVMRQQDKWLKDTLGFFDEMRREQEELLEQNLREQFGEKV